MAVFSNQGWVQDGLAQQLATLQNSMIPPGEAWKQYLNGQNALNPSLQQQLGYGNAVLWGPNGFPGITDALTTYQNNLPGMFSAMTGNGHGTSDAQQQLIDAIFGNTAQVNNAFSMFNNGSGQGQDLYNTALGQFNNPYNQGMGDIGNYLMSSLGQTPYSQSQKDMANYNLKQGGWTPQLSSGFDAATGMINAGGVTPGLASAYGMANDIYGKSGALSQNVMGQGQGMINSGQNWTNPQLQAGMQGALGLIGSQGSNTNLNDALSTYKGQVGTQGMGNLAPGFDYAGQLMQGGGQSPFTLSGAQLAQMYASGGGPSITQGIGMSMPSIGGISAMAGFTPGADVSAGPVDSGYSQSINDVIDKAKKILDENPLIPMNQAISMARDASATATSQQYQAMMGRALARGGGPGATVANGLQNRGMAEYADAGAQAEAKAMREMALSQQGLQLQKYGIGADLTKAMEQVAAQRNSTSSSLAGQVASANAGIHAANASASGNVAAANASIQAQLAKAQMDLYGQLAGLNVQRQMTGLGDLAQFSGQDNQMRLGGLNAMAGLQGAANQKYGIDTNAYLGVLGQMADREKTGYSALGNLEGVQNQGQLGRIDAGAKMLDTGAGIFNAGNSTAAGLLNNTNSTASNNLMQSMDLINKYQQTANQGVGTWGDIFNKANQSELDWTKLGAGLSQNNVQNTQNLLGIIDKINGTNNSYQLGMGNLANNLWQTQQSGLNTSFNNGLALNKLDLDKFNSYNTAFNNNMNTQNNNAANIAQAVANAQNTYQSGNNALMSYLGGAQQGFGSVNVGAGGGDTFLGGLLKSAAAGGAQAAGNKAFKS